MYNNKSCQFYTGIVLTVAYTLVLFVNSVRTDFLGPNNRSSRANDRSSCVFAVRGGVGGRLGVRSGARSRQSGDDQRGRVQTQFPQRTRLQQRVGRQGRHRLRRGARDAMDTRIRADEGTPSRQYYNYTTCLCSANKENGAIV